MTEPQDITEPTPPPPPVGVQLKACPFCAYPLATTDATQIRCPECGREFPARDLFAAWMTDEQWRRSAVRAMQWTLAALFSHGALAVSTVATFALSQTYANQFWERENETPLGAVVSDMNSVGSTISMIAMPISLVALFMTARSAIQRPRPARKTALCLVLIAILSIPTLVLNVSFHIAAEWTYPDTPEWIRTIYDSSGTNALLWLFYAPSFGLVVALPCLLLHFATFPFARGVRIALRVVATLVIGIELSCGNYMMLMLMDWAMQLLSMSLGLGGLMQTYVLYSFAALVEVPLLILAVVFVLGAIRALGRPSGSTTPSASTHLVLGGSLIALPALSAYLWTSVGVAWWVEVANQDFSLPSRAVKHRIMITTVLALVWIIPFAFMPRSKLWIYPAVGGLAAIIVAWALVPSA